MFSHPDDKNFFCKKMLLLSIKKTPKHNSFFLPKNTESI